MGARATAVFVHPLTLSIAAGALLAGCARANAGATPARAEEAPVQVETVEASERPMPRWARLTGGLVGAQETRLAANAAGKVLDTAVERGAEVQRGQVLARLDTRQATLAAAEARASLASLEARQAHAKTECERAETLLASGVLPRAQYDQVKLSCTLSPSDRAASQARAQMAMLNVGDGLVRAPFAGVITERRVSAGEYVRADTAVFSLVNLGALRLEVAVPEVLVGTLRPGTRVRFSVPAHPERSFDGALQKPGQAVRPQSRDVLVDADVDNADHALLPGMFASVELPLDPAPAVVVPSTAVRERDGRARVLVRKDGRLEERVVELGAEVDGQRALLRGVAVGEAVVRAPAPELRNGQPARLHGATTMQWLAQISVRRPVFASVLMLLLLVLGLAGYRRLGVDEFPNVDFPVVVVTTRLPGAAPEEVESDITDKIEAAVNTISGIDELRSTSSEGISQVVVQFELSRSTDAATQDVRDKVNSVLGDLPKGIDAPVVSKVDPSSSPIMLIALRGPSDRRDLTEAADRVVRRRIESINGVGQVSLIGGQKRQVNVWLDPVKLRAMGVTALEVQRALATQNVSLPGGTLEAGPSSVSLRIQGRVAGPDAVGNVVIKETAGRAIVLSEVARVEDGAAEAQSAAQLDDEPSVILAVRKQSGTNTIAVVDTVRGRLAEVERALPSGYHLEVVRDNSGVIRTGLHAVTEHLILGALLAAVVVFLFLGNARSTVISALAIPISIIGTFAVMWAVGYTLNFLTLLALALAVGIVIDDAIVVLENIVRFIQTKGFRPFPAAVLATREIGLAVLATTLSLIAVFVPVGFMGGIVGRFLAAFGFTMAFAIAVSLLVSFTLTPMLAARWLPPPAEGQAGGGHGPRNLVERLVDTFYAPIERAYMAVLRFSMAHRWVVVLACVGALGSVGPLGKRVPGGFIPADDKAQFEVSVRAPEGTSLEETRLIAERVAQEARRLPGVQHTLLTVADDALSTTNLGKIIVFLTDPAARSVSQVALMDRTRREILPRYPALRMAVSEVASFSSGSSNAEISYALTGPELGPLTEATSRIVEKLRSTPGAADVDSTMILGKPETSAVIRRDVAADLGVRVADVAATLRLFVAGEKVGTVAEAGEEYDVRVRAERSERASAESFGALSVPSSKYGAVPMANLLSYRDAKGPANIDRLARQRQFTLTSNVKPGVGSTTVSTALKAIVADEKLPPGYQLVPVGRTKEQEKLGLGFLAVIGLSFVFMYLVLAAQFESWLHPVTILTSLPLTVPFALLSLLLFGQTLNLFSALGLLVLFGVVKKNAILQIDHTNHLRSLGLPRLDAILEANRDRLRPILMTTLAFVAGMVPLVTSKGVGAGFNQSTAAIVLGGQSLSLLLTLVAVPVLYSLLDDLQGWFGRLRGAVAVDRGEADLERLLHGEKSHAE